MDFGLTPLLVAPMAGGPSTAGLVVAAGQAGAVGFLAGGYKSVGALEGEIKSVQESGFLYGVNLFVPGLPLGDLAPLERYRDVLQAEAERYGVELPGLRASDDDQFAAKVELVVASRVPFVSFTFGVPELNVVEAVHSGGGRVLVTVTSASEAVRALAVGADVLIAQGGGAGGHSATGDPVGYRGDRSTHDVVADVLAAGLGRAPVVAAGGVGTAGDVARLLSAGAVAVQCGTAFLLAAEAGTREVQRAAMESGEFRETVVTRAFTGQPARALRNRFTDAYTAVAPVGYPAVHHLTAPLRAAAARAGDAGGLNLWAGTGFAAARAAPVAELLDNLRP